MLPYIMKTNSLSITTSDGVPQSVNSDHPNYSTIRTKIANNDWEGIEELLTITSSIKQWVSDSVTFKDGTIYYKDQELHSVFTQYILDSIKSGDTVDYLIRFLENLMLNPSHRAVQELYSFLEDGSMALTEDGYFLTYKKIRENWTDIHSGTFDNSIGAKPYMPRNMVDENSEKTCSNGLHVCSYDYLSHFGGCDSNRVVLCKVNPKDVVAIPKDYNNTKMRVCEYEVLQEVGKTNDILKDTTVLKIDKHKLTAGRILQFDSDKRHVMTYDSVKHAQEETGVFATNISKVLNGRRTMAGGYYWVRTDDINTLLVNLGEILGDAGMFTTSAEHTYEFYTHEVKVLEDFIGASLNTNEVYTFDEVIDYVASYFMGK